MNAPRSITAPTRRTLVPHYPVDARTRALLNQLDGVPRRTLTGMIGSLAEQRGTPQAQVDWSDPDAWLDEKLEGEELALARRIWEGSGRTANPRHVRGAWSVIDHHKLAVAEGAGALRLTDRGRDFLASPHGAVAKEIDAFEGLLKILELVVEHGPAARGDLEGPWRTYLLEVSNLRSEVAARQSLSERLRNLVERGFIDRSGGAYVMTAAGVSYLESAPAPPDEGNEPEEDRKLRALLTQHLKRFREQLRGELAQMDPFAFERLVGQLLEAMGYDGVTVTARSGDGGADVTGRIQLGITEVNEVIQVKRHAKNIPRHTLDALRGSLHRFRAVRGTIITTGDFARGTREAAFELGAPPITLIDGEKLIDLLIENKVGVRKKPIEMLELDRAAFAVADDDVQPEQP